MLYVCPQEPLIFNLSPLIFNLSPLFASVLTSFLSGHYFQETQAIIWVVDSCDRERLPLDYRTELHRLARELPDIVFLIFANKQDLPNVAHFRAFCHLLISLFFFFQFRQCPRWKCKKFCNSMISTKPGIFLDLLHLMELVFTKDLIGLLQ